MTLIRVFPRKTKWTPTDDMAFVGDPPLMRPDADEVHVSVAFTWDLPEGQRLQKAWAQYYPKVLLGGPALDDRGDYFVPGRYIREGVVFTSRGCPFKCPWCFVPRREGAIRELPIARGHIVNDNNLLACSRQHIDAVFAMLRGQSLPAVFRGGIDTKLLKPWHAELFASIRLGEIWVACDTETRLRLLRKARNILADIPLNKRRCYVLIGFDGESVGAAEQRLKEVYEIGFLPFAQLYQGPQATKWTAEWRALNRKWSRPAAYRSKYADYL